MTRFLKIAAAFSLPALLSGCLLTPGAFESDLKIGKNGLFSYRYKGEIVIASADVMFDGMAGMGPQAPIFNADHTYCEGPVPRGQKVTDKRAIPVEDQIEAPVVEEMSEDIEAEAGPKPKSSELQQKPSAEESEKTVSKSAEAAKAAEAAVESAAQAAKDAADSARDVAKDAPAAAVKTDEKEDEPKEKFEVLDNDGEIIQRRCTSREMAKKKRDFDNEQIEIKRVAAERRAEMGKQIKSEFGYDPSSEIEMARFAKDMRKEPGWKSLVYKGKGVYTVDYNYTGTLDRDFIFPVFPQSKLITPFVMIRKRNDGSAYVTAPAFARATANNLMNRSSSMMSLAASFMNKDYVPPTTRIKGRFSISTDGAILTNNTVDGPEGSPGDQRLTWSIFAAEDRVPETLIKFSDGGAK